MVTQRRPLAMATAELEAIWSDHVERAEGPGGLHAFLCAASPGYLPVVTLLRARQRALLDDLARLRRLALRSSARSSWLRTEYGRLARAVVTHDELETEILCDAIERG
jgi:hypothetical protein